MSRVLTPLVFVCEEHGEWQRALDAYQAALGYKENDVNKKGIDKLGQ